MSLNPVLPSGLYTSNRDTMLSCLKNSNDRILNLLSNLISLTIRLPSIKSSKALAT